MKEKKVKVEEEEEDEREKEERDEAGGEKEVEDLLSKQFPC